MTKRIIITCSVFILACLLVVFRLQSNRVAISKLAALSSLTHAQLPVEVILPITQALNTGLVADGIFMPIKEMWVLSETQGHIIEVYKAKGERVQAGDQLAKIDDSMLQLELQTVALNLEKLEKDRERLTKLIDADAVAANKIEEVQLGIATAQAKIKGIQKQILNTTIKAPMSGTMTYRVVEKDGVIGLGIQVAQLTDISTLLLTVRVPELDVNSVKKGQEVVVTPDAMPLTTLRGKVRNIGIKADQAFTYDIEVEVKNTPDQSIRAGMHARAAFQVQGSEGGVFIPAETLVGNNRKNAQVYVLENDSIARLRSIQIEKEVGGRLKIASGLIATDKVISSGSLTLTDGAKVTVVQD
jgi:membrane fusion protein, multidrug efflux system